jgi:fluoroquinolone transport system permease protein
MQLYRLAATLRLDARLQLRNGFYFAAGFVVLIVSAILTQLPPLDWGYLMPALVQNNLLISTFYFMGGLVLLERGEGTLESQIVTPLRTREYLLSKVITLTALALVENLIILIVAQGLAFSPFWWCLGSVCAGALYSLLGFVTVARYDSINEYLFPSFLVAIVLALPLLDYFGIVSSPLFYLHPVQALLLLLRAAFVPLELWQLGYAVAYSSFWIALAYLWCERTFRRFVVVKAGGGR